MLSAKSGDKIYVAGMIDNPKSREYTCVHCGESMKHVSSCLRSGKHLVVEHFRHPRHATHPHRPAGPQRMRAVNEIVRQLQESYSFEVAVDQIMEFGGRQYPVDIVVSDHDVDRSSIQTVIQVEAQGFRFKDMDYVRQSALRQGMYVLPIFCAQHDQHHPKGKYYRKQVRENKTEVARIPGNEKVIVDRIGFGAYFSFDDHLVHRVRFGQYSERLKEDVTNRAGDVVRRRGETQEFTDLKTIIEDIPVSKLKFEYRRNHRGDLLAVPREPNFGDALHAERLARARGDPAVEDMTERIGIYLQNASPECISLLTEKYGPEALGPYASRR